MKKPLSILFLLISILFLSCHPKTIADLGGLRMEVSSEDGFKDKSELTQTCLILQKRLNNFCKNATVRYDTIANLIIIELSKETDVDLYTELIEKKGKFRILETYDNYIFYNQIERINAQIRIGNNFDVEQVQMDESRDTPFLYTLLSPPYYGDQLQRGPEIGYVQSKDTANLNLILSQLAIKQLLPSDLSFYWVVYSQSENCNILIAIKEPVQYQPITSNMIESAKSTQQKYSGNFVSFSFKKDYHSLWARMTKNNIAKQLALIIDGIVYSYPTVQAEITGGACMISGNLTEQQAEILAAILTSGELKTQLTVNKVEIFSKNK